MSALITIKRVARLGDGCFGVILHLGVPFAVTLERTFEDGNPIIPAGTYLCLPRPYHKGGYDTFEITGVEGHSLLLFHKANWETDLQGCVGIGESYAVLQDRLAIGQSGAGFAEFWHKVKGLTQFEVTVEDCC